MSQKLTKSERPSSPLHRGVARSAGGLFCDHAVSVYEAMLTSVQPPVSASPSQPPGKGARGRACLCLLALCLFLTGCTPVLPVQPKQFEASFLDVFDTITYIKGRAESKEAFQTVTDAMHTELLEYHQLFDIYNDYDGINNLKTVNDNAGIAPVPVDERILDLLTDCKTYYDATNGLVNAAMGSVLVLWHEAREAGFHDPVNAYLPDQDALEAAGLHTDLDALVIDAAAGTVYLTDPEARLDVGAIAKGWATQRVCDNAPAGLLVSVGGNVCATGAKDDRGTPWVVGVQDPADSASYLHTLEVTSGSVVTSGSYQRAYAVDGQLYHHIIDPDTLYPSQSWTSVTVYCQDSGLADALSTALFLAPLAEGRTMLEQFDAEAMWVAPDGTITMTDGFEEMIRT